MTENIDDNKNSLEKIHNEREVLNLFEEIIGNGEYEILRSLEDEQGLYMLEVQTTDESNDIVLYQYVRAGKHPEGSSAETAIDVVYYSGDMPVGGRAIKKFKDGEWVQEPV